MKASPRVSVVLIFWNAEQFLAEAIESVLGQTYDSWELILVDDGSTDGSTQIAGDCARKNPERVFHLRHEGHANRGMSASRNLGIQSARGEYVALLDADDVWLPQKLARQIQVLDTHEEVPLTYGPAQFWFGWTGRREDTARDSVFATGFPPDTVVRPPEVLLRFLREEIPVPLSSSALARRTLFETVGGFEPAFRDLYEDQVFFAKVCLRKPVFVEGEYHTLYRQHPDSACEKALRAGNYAFGRPHPAGRAFLSWLEGYLAAESCHDTEVARALRERLRPYRQPLLDRFRRAGSRFLGRIDASIAGLEQSASHLARGAARAPTGSIIASPNPIPALDRHRVGVTTLTWSSERTEHVEIRVGSPDGALFSRTGPCGSAATGMWVSDGMTFYLQDASEERRTGPRNTLASVTLRVDHTPGRQPAAWAQRAESFRVEEAANGDRGAKALVIGWFSFEGMPATAGDLLARDLICAWLSRAEREFDVALSPAFGGGVDWKRIEPSAYSEVLFVCGPFVNAPPLSDLLRRFSSSRLIAVNVSLNAGREFSQGPFHLLIERDGFGGARPDITFLAPTVRVPVVGLVQIREPQTEYGENGRHASASGAIHRLLSSRPAAVVPIDTRLDENVTGLRSAAEIESLIGRMDVVVTTRLHGLVFALKNGVPALAVDPIAGGAKIRRQAEAIGWPVVFVADLLDDEALVKGFEYCLSPEARSHALECADRAAKMVEKVRDQFVAAMSLPGEIADV
jgi:glycosyltransferase involved in cell wall biosynthesis